MAQRRRRTKPPQNCIVCGEIVAGASLSHDAIHLDEGWICADCCISGKAMRWDQGDSAEIGSPAASGDPGALDAAEEARREATEETRQWRSKAVQIAKKAKALQAELEELRGRAEATSAEQAGSTPQDAPNETLTDDTQGLPPPQFEEELAELVELRRKIKAASRQIRSTEEEAGEARSRANALRDDLDVALEQAKDADTRAEDATSTAQTKISEAEELLGQAIDNERAVRVELQQLQEQISAQRTHGFEEARRRVLDALTDINAPTPGGGERSPDLLREDPEAENSMDTNPTKNTDKSYDQYPGAKYFLLPENCTAWVIPRIRLVLSRANFEKVSVRCGWFGLIGLCATIVFTLIYCLVYAIRVDSLQMALMALLSPLAGALLQYIAIRFSDQCEMVVRNTPSRMSGSHLFDVLGIAFFLGGLAFLGSGFYLLVKIGFEPGSYFSILSGMACLVASCVYLNSSLMNIVVDKTATVGQDGLTILGSFIKAAMASIRLIFGVSAMAGGLLVAIGSVWFLFTPDRDAMECFSVGLATTLVGGLMPLAAYIIASIYYIIVDVLDSIIRLGDRSKT